MSLLAKYTEMDLFMLARNPRYLLIAGGEKEETHRGFY
jgi:hypothetical protein